MLEREQYYLDTLLFAQEYIRKENNKFLELGYNINPFAANRLGSHQSKESIKKSVLNNSKVLSVVHYDFNGNKIGEYFSTGEAAKAVNINRNCIYNCCKHNIDYTYKGFFIYKNEEEMYKEYFESFHKNAFVIQPWNKGIKTGRIDKKESVILFDRYGRYIKIFTHQSDVSEFLHTSTSNISHYKNKKPLKNYLIFDIDFDYKSIINKLREDYWFVYTDLTSIDCNKILVFDVFDNFISSFETVIEASETMNLNCNSIYNVLCGKRKQLKGFKFKYSEDIV